MELPLPKTLCGWRTSERACCALQGCGGGHRDECTTSLARLTDDVVAATVKVELSGRSVAEARRDLAKLDRHYAEGGSRRTFFGTRPAVVKETDWVEQAVSLEGAAIQSAEEILARTAGARGMGAARCGLEPLGEVVADATGRREDTGDGVARPCGAVDKPPRARRRRFGTLARHAGVAGRRPGRRRLQPELGSSPELSTC